MLLRMFASHGYNVIGQQSIVTDEFDVINDFYKMISAEYDTRQMASKLPHVYFLDLYACCRGIYNGASAAKEE